MANLTNTSGACYLSEGDLLAVQPPGGDRACLSLLPGLHSVTGLPNSSGRALLDTGRSILSVEGGAQPEEVPLLVPKASDCLLSEAKGAMTAAPLLVSNASSCLLLDAEEVMTAEPEPSVAEAADCSSLSATKATMTGRVPHMVKLTPSTVDKGAGGPKEPVPDAMMTARNLKLTSSEAVAAFRAKVAVCLRRLPATASFDRASGSALRTDGVLPLPVANETDCSNLSVSETTLTVAGSTLDSGATAAGLGPRGIIVCPTGSLVAGASVESKAQRTNNGPLSEPCALRRTGSSIRSAPSTFPCQLDAVGDVSCPRAEHTGNSQQRLPAGSPVAAGTIPCSQGRDLAKVSTTRLLKCADCEFQTTNQSGLSNHMRVKHVARYHEAIVSKERVNRKKRPRWEPEDSLLMAEEAIRLESIGAKGKDLTKRLAEFMLPNRTFDAVKSHMKQASYRKICDALRSQRNEGADWTSSPKEEACFGAYSSPSCKQLSDRLLSLRDRGGHCTSSPSVVAEPESSGSNGASIEVTAASAREEEPNSGNGLNDLSPSARNPESTERGQGPARRSSRTQRGVAGASKSNSERGLESPTIPPPQGRGVASSTGAGTNGSSGSLSEGYRMTEAEAKSNLLNACLESSELLGISEAQVHELAQASESRTTEGNGRVQEMVDTLFNRWLGIQTSEEKTEADEASDETTHPSGTAKERPRKKKEGSKRAQRRQKYAQVQQLFRRKRKACADLVLSGDWDKDKASTTLGEQEGFWGRLMETDSTPDLREPKDGCVPVWETLRPVTDEEYDGVLKGAHNGAPGVDRMDRAKARSLKNDEVVAHMNLWLMCGCPPSCFRSGITCPIAKCAEAKGPEEYRPITLSPFLCRLFHRVLVLRFNAELPLSERQKAFRRGDGLADNVYILRTLIEDAKRRHKPLNACFLDVKKAFDSVSHQSILIAAKRLGMPEPLLRYLASLYDGSVTRLRVNGRLGRVIHVKRGVRQGDPMSPFLFNAVVDWILSRLNPDFGIELGDGVKVNNLAFADDVVLLCRTTSGLQRLVDQYAKELGLCGLQLNARKSASLSICANGKAKRWFVNSEPFVRVGEELIPTLGLEQTYKYLGLGVGVLRTKSCVLDKLRDGLKQLSRAPLKPQQRMYLLRAHFLPQFIHELVLDRVTQGTLRAMDVTVRAAIRQWLRLPKDTARPIFHAPAPEGGLAILEFATRIPIMYRERMCNLAARAAMGVDKVLTILAERPGWLCDLLGRVQRMKTVYGQCAWTKDEVKQATVDALVRSVDGAGLGEHGNVRGLSNWVTNGGDLLSGANYVRAIQVRSGTLYTKARAARGRPSQDRNCDANCRKVETLAHILQVCKRTWGERIDRHNRAVDYLAEVWRKQGYEVIIEPAIQSYEGRRVPDMVVFRPNQKAMVTDVTVVADNANLDEKHQEKVSYYDNPKIRQFVSSLTGVPAAEVRFSAVAYNWRGALSRSSAKDLRSWGVTRAHMEVLSVRILELGYGMYSSWKVSTWRLPDWDFRMRRPLSAPPPGAQIPNVKGVN